MNSVINNTLYNASPLSTLQWLLKPPYHLSRSKIKICNKIVGKISFILLITRIAGKSCRRVLKKIIKEIAIVLNLNFALDTGLAVFY